MSIQIKSYNFKIPHSLHSSKLQYLVAIATPIDLPNRSVFFSYNFEVNYGLPSPYNKFPDSYWVKQALQKKHAIKKRDLVNRRSIYQMIEENLET